jgi:hypoxanthine phosphoribosyltransferase
MGIVRITKDLDTNIASKNVLLVEDIVDTGLTLNYLLKNLRTRKPLSLRVCALLDMPARRIVNVPVDYRGFEMPDVYVVGYGLDYQERYRNLKEIAVLK